MNRNNSNYSNEKVVINISGMRFETYFSKINKFPETLLGNSEKRERYFDIWKNEYFFDRHQQSFESIFIYYQSNGQYLSRPANVPPEIFFDEIIFFQLGEEAIDRYKKAEGYLIDKPAKIKDLPKNNILRSLWLLFEYPESSFYARVIAIISLIMILSSIALFCIETMPIFKKRRNQSASNSKLNYDEFFIIETICIIWFSIELLLRFISSPYKIPFIKFPGNIIDLFSLIPYVLQVSDISEKLAILRMIRLIRVFRIFKLVKHFKGLQILVQTFKASAKELALLSIFLMIGIILFSSCVYFFETEVPESDFPSIPHSFWYALVTMTTVGYGDMVPKSTVGRLFGSMCALAGILTIALPVPVIVSNFNFFYISNNNLKQISIRSLKASFGPSSENLIFNKNAMMDPFSKCLQARRKRLQEREMLSIRI